MMTNKSRNYWLKRADREQFLDKFVQNKAEGGREAAQQLRDCALSYIREKFPHIASKVKIMVFVCCNLKGLSKTCSDAAILEKPEDFQQFARGFNMGDPMCYLVDAGSGKECSDDKLRGMFVIVEQGETLLIYSQRCLSFTLSCFNVSRSFSVGQLIMAMLVCLGRIPEIQYTESV